MAVKPHAAVWSPDAPTSAQLKELFAQIDSGRITRERLQSFLCGDRRLFSIWKTIKLGTGLRTADDFRSALKEKGCRISNWANDLLGQPGFTAATEEMAVDLAVATTAQLTGNPGGGTTAQVFAGANRLGLAKCPAEVGPQLRIQYPDQPSGEWLLIGMEPIADSDGRLRVFSVGRGDSASWLDAYYGYPGGFWSPDRQWAFVRPRPSTRA